MLHCPSLWFNVSIQQAWKKTPRVQSIYSCFGLDIVCQAPSNNSVCACMRVWCVCACCSVLTSVTQSPGGGEQGDFTKGELCFCQKRWSQELLRKDSSLCLVTRHHCSHITLQCIFLQKTCFFDPGRMKAQTYTVCVLPLPFCFAQTLPITITTRPNMCRLCV